jgi:hypothetical protein
MRTFRCHCGNTLHFENSRCLRCGRTLGYVPEIHALGPFEPAGEGLWQGLHPEAGGLYRMCANYANEDVCNWVVAQDDPQPLCRACRLNHVIPNLSEPRNRVLWYRIEGAKRRLLYTLYALDLPVVGHDEDPDSGLRFEFLADPRRTAEFADDMGQRKHVVTGHRSGLITINIAEADPKAREEMREKMREAYRTLLGHFRHEIGHYYWDRLVGSSGWLGNFRALFGDEREEYDAALARYYQGGPPGDWREQYVSAYCAAHPWEDWAETWAHYLHMVDTLETAHDFAFAIEGRPLLAPAAAPVPAETGQRAAGEPVPGASFEELIADWGRLGVALNALNRSMGLGDAYPFVLSPRAVEKLRFVHRVIAQSQTQT